MTALTNREAVQAAARDLALTVPDATCTLVVCGPAPAYQHTLTALVPGPVAAAAVVAAMTGATWDGTEGTWRGLSVLLVIEEDVPPVACTDEDLAWWPREHFEHPEVSPERAAAAIEFVHRLHLVGGCS